MTKLLIVDDDALITSEMCEFLSTHGFSCIACHNAEAALAQLEQHPDLCMVLSDLRLPGLSGLELVQDISQRYGRDRHIEALIFTGQAQHEDIIAALRAGVADFLQKPVDLPQLLDAVKRLQSRLQRYHAEHQLGSQLQGLANSLRGIYPQAYSSNTANQPSSAYQAPTEPVPAQFENLSPRQFAVAQQVAKGLTNYQIACELGITENTVKLYVSQVLRLTGMHNRTQLALSLTPAREKRRQL